MARKNARLLVAIWADSDFVSLKTVEQNVYLSLISSPDLSWCGVNPYLPKRLALTASDLTERKVVAAMDVLREKRFVVVDDRTDEVLVRTFIRHDEVLRVPNVTKGMLSALNRVHSEQIRSVIVDELAREYVDHPRFTGWKAVADGAPELFDEVCAKGSGKGSPKGSANGSADLWGDGS